MDFWIFTFEKYFKSSFKNIKSTFFSLSYMLKGCRTHYHEFVATDTDVLVEKLDLSQIEFEDSNSEKPAIQEKSLDALSGSGGKICI